MGLRRRDNVLDVGLADGPERDAGHVRRRERRRNAPVGVDPVSGGRGYVSLDVGGIAVVAPAVIDAAAVFRRDFKTAPPVGGGAPGHVDVAADHGKGERPRGQQEQAGGTEKNAFFLPVHNSSPMARRSAVGIRIVVIFAKSV